MKLRDTNLPIDADCICEDLGEAKKQQSNMLKHVISVNKIRCCNGVLYFYNIDDSCWKLMKDSEEWLIIGYLFSKEIRQNIRSSQITELIKCLKFYRDIQIQPEQLNNQTHLVNLRNSVYSITEQKRYEHNADYYFTNVIDADYIPNTCIDDAPTFKKFCMTSLGKDKGKWKLLLQIIGWMLCLLWGIKKMFFLIGVNDSGKSVICELLRLLIGVDNTSNLPLHCLNSDYAKAELLDKHANICSELNYDKSGDSDTIKIIISGDRMTGRAPYGRYQTREIRCKMLFAGNAMPPIGTDEITGAMAKKIIILYFPYEVTDIDLNLLDKLLNERNQIVSMALDELKELIENDYQFCLPNDSMTFIEKQKFQANHIKTFINENCELGNENLVSTVKLYDEYTNFCKDNNVIPVKLYSFHQAICNIEGVSHGRRRLEKKNPVAVFLGIKLKE